MKFITTIVLFAVLAANVTADRILVFSKTAGRRNLSIASGAEATRKFGKSICEGGQDGDLHPLTWCQKFDGGRMFCTAGGIDGCRIIRYESQ